MTNEVMTNTAIEAAAFVLQTKLGIMTLADHQALEIANAMIAAYEQALVQEAQRRAAMDKPTK